MLRKLTIMLAVIAAIGVAAIPTGASAAWHGGGGGWHGGGYRGGYYGGYRGGYYGGGWGIGAGLLGGALIGGGACISLLLWLRPLLLRWPYYGGCYRTVRVSTPYGWRLRRVWVCQ